MDGIDRSPDHQAKKKTFFARKTRKSAALSAPSKSPTRNAITITFNQKRCHRSYESLINAQHNISRVKIVLVICPWQQIKACQSIMIIRTKVIFMHTNVSPELPKTRLFFSTCGQLTAQPLRQLNSTCHFWSPVEFSAKFKKQFPILISISKRWQQMTFTQPQLSVVRYLLLPTATLSLSCSLAVHVLLLFACALCACVSVACAPNKLCPQINTIRSRLLFRYFNRMCERASTVERKNDNAITVVCTYACLCVWVCVCVQATGSYHRILTLRTAWTRACVRMRTITRE